MSEIDTDKMIEMARERAGWVLMNRKVITTPAGMDDIVTIARHTIDARFIAQTPATILAQAAHIATLEARLAALGEWRAVAKEMPSFVRYGSFDPPTPDQWVLFWYDGAARRAYIADHGSTKRWWVDDGIINVNVDPEDLWQPMPTAPSFD